MDVSSHTLMLPTDGTVPEWLHVLPAGAFSGSDGRGPYALIDVQKVIAASMEAGKLPVDENHSIQIATQRGEPSPARGWIVELQSRADGVWGRVDWTKTGHAMMADKSYRGISPVFGHEDGTVMRLISAALTNSANLPQLATLHTTTPQPGDTMNINAIRAALGLAADADEAAVLAAIGKAKETVSTHTAEIAKLKTSTAPVDQVVALQTQLDTLRTERAQEKAVAFVDAAIKAGKPINAVREQYIAQHVANPASTEAMVNGLPSINAGGGGSKVALQTGGGGDELSKEEIAICTKMGTDPKEYAKFKSAKTEGSAV